MQEQRNAVARFLEARDMKREALDIATDADYRFDLAVSLGELGVALQLAEQSGSELKWRQLGELALSSGKLQACSSSHPLHVAPAIIWHCRLGCHCAFHQVPHSLALEDVTF